jgi:hypothetical protein
MPITMTTRIVFLPQVDEEEDNKSVQKCRFWQCTSLFLFLFIIALTYVHPTSYLIGFCVGEFLFRSVGIYFVGKFVGELEEENNLNSSHAQLYYFDADAANAANSAAAGGGGDLLMQQQSNCIAPPDRRQQGLFANNQF